MKIAVFLGSIRKGRTGENVAAWAMEQLRARGDGNTYELVDLAKQDLDPQTSIPPRQVENGDYDNPKTRAWAQLIGGFDGFIFLTPEYNASVPGPMKDAYDLLYAEWTGKPVGLVGYGSDGAATARKHWNDIVTRVGMKPASTQVAYTFEEHFPDFTFVPGEQGEAAFSALMDELTSGTE